MKRYTIILGFDKFHWFLIQRYIAAVLKGTERPCFPHEENIV